MKHSTTGALIFLLSVSSLEAQSIRSLDLATNRGPQPVDNPQILLMAGPGLDRNATVGFRCVEDATPKD